MRWRATIHCELTLTGTEHDATRIVNEHKRILQDHFDRVASTTIRADLCELYEVPREPFGRVNGRVPEHRAVRSVLGHRARRKGPLGEA